jgi:putative SOS response-associated peptidase YedK
MVRRSTPQRKTDDAAFPVRVKLTIPDGGLGLRLNDIHRWLLTEIGSGHYAVHPAPSLGREALAIHLRGVECARMFLADFPDLDLADGTISRSYSSPAHDSAWDSGDIFGVCNLYSMTSAQTAITELANAMSDSTGNMPVFPGIFPDQSAPVVRNSGQGRALTMMRWGMPPPAFAMKGKKVERGVTNVRNTASPHWRRWLGVDSRCVVPFTSFCEYDTRAGKAKEPVWFARDESRPLAFFAGIWTEWTSVRKLKEGETTNNLFGFLTTEANAVVSPIHPKAMPVILTEPDQVEQWLCAPAEEALSLQHPLDDSGLVIVTRGKLSDDPDVV